jgi:hypothetical protein
LRQCCEFKLFLLKKLTKQLAFLTTSTATKNAKLFLGKKRNLSCRKFAKIAENWRKWRKLAKMGKIAENRLKYRQILLL